MAESTSTAPASFGESARREFGYSPFFPLLLLVLAAVVWPAFQCYQLVAEKQGLATVYTNQTQPYENAAKLRASLENLARETAILADKGNAGAKMIVGELAKRGVTINPNPPAATTDKAAK